METFSGSVVEPAVPYLPPDYQNQQKQKKFFVIVAIIEAITIVGLVILLILLATSSPKKDSSEAPVTEDFDVSEFYDYPLNENESSTLMLLYAIASNSQLNVSAVSSGTCTTLMDIYNRLSIDESQLTEPCINNQITLSAKNIESEFYPNLMQYRLSVLMNDESYDFYSHTDFLTFSYAKKSNILPDNTVTVRIESK